jgi:hypothetical protein
MISHSAEPWWYLGWILAAAAILGCYAPRLLRHGAWLLVALEGTLLLGLLVGDLLGHQEHSWRFNSLLLCGTILVLGIFLGVSSLRPGLTGERHDAAVKLRLPAAIFVVAGGWLVWTTVVH